MIPENYIRETCKLGQGEACCAFLMMGQDGMECAKETGAEGLIRKRLDAGTMNAKGDNCEGWANYVLELVE